MRHLNVKCWPEAFDAITSGRKRADLRVTDRDFQIGDAVELVRWDPIENVPSIGRAEILITHIDHQAGPLGLYGMERRPGHAAIYHPLACLSFAFIRADYPHPPQEQSTTCSTGADDDGTDGGDEVTPVRDRR
jgi:hypothetical protein